MFSLLRSIIHLIQPFLVPICFVSAWALVGMVLWGLWTGCRDVVKGSQRLHKIPCSDCQYFTDSHLLKCTLHPYIALTEDAIDCVDYESTVLKAPSESLAGRR